MLSGMLKIERSEILNSQKIMMLAMLISKLGLFNARQEKRLV